MRQLIMGPLVAAFLAAAVLHFAIALLVLFTGTRKPPHWIAAIFLALLGGSALARGLHLATIDHVDELASITPYTFVPADLEWPASFLVLALALFYPRPLLSPRMGRLVLVAGGAGVLALWAFAITLHPVSVRILDAPSWFDLVTDDLRYYAATFAAIALLGWHHLRRPLDSPDRSAEHLLIAFSLAPLAAATLVLAHPADAAAALQAVAGNGATGDIRRAIADAGTLLIVLLYVGLVLLAARRGHRTRALVAWGVGIGAFGALVGLAGVFVPYFSRYGDLTYLILRPCLIGYAILRHQLFDIDVRVKRGFATTLMLLVIAALFVPIEEAVRRLSGLPYELALPVGIGAGFAVCLVLYARVQTFARGATDRLFANVREDDTRYLLSRKRDIYRALLERAAQPDDPEVAKLRASLGITDEQHHEILAQIHGEPGEGAPAPPGALLAGRYRVLATLGEGAGGTTYRCEDTTLRREVAVKEIDLDAPGGRARRRAIGEARRLAAIRHDHVVTLLDVQETRRRTLLIMELMHGGSLAAKLARGPLAPEEARRILGEVLHGLDALHKAGFVHRDVKPSNVLLDARGRAKIADLGIASGSELDTVAGLSTAGTPLYMAPEQLLGLPVDARADVYAAAGLLYEMLAGEAYVRAAMRQGALVQEAIVSAPPPLPLAGAPAWANEILASGLAKDPGRRYASAADALAALTRDPGTGSASAPASARPPDEAGRLPPEGAGAS